MSHEGECNEDEIRALAKKFEDKYVRWYIMLMMSTLKLCA